MLKQEDQTHGQKLLKQLRDTYKKPEAPVLDASEEDLICEDAPLSWPPAISHSIN